MRNRALFIGCLARAFGCPTVAAMKGAARVGWGEFASPNNQCYTQQRGIHHELANARLVRALCCQRPALGEQGIEYAHDGVLVGFGQRADAPQLLRNLQYRAAHGEAWGCRFEI